MPIGPGVIEGDAGREERGHELGAVLLRVAVAVDVKPLFGQVVAVLGVGVVVVANDGLLRVRIVILRLHGESGGHDGEVLTRRHFGRYCVRLESGEGVRASILWESRVILGGDGRSRQSTAVTGDCWGGRSLGIGRM